MAIYFHFSLSTRTFKVTITSAFKFSITCLVSELLKDKKTKTLVIRHLGYAKKSMTSQQGKILFLKKQLANMFDVKILRDLYIYTSYINYEVLKIFLLEFN